MEQPKKVATVAGLIQPRTVSLKELRDKLWPYIATYPWADDAINDLWKLGAPDPHFNMCPQVREKTGKPCPMRECTHVKRILLPTQFEQWWQDVRRRQSVDLTAAAALNRHGRPRLH